MPSDNRRSPLAVQPARTTPAPSCAWSPERLAGLIAESGLSLREVARRAGVEPSSLSRLATGDRLRETSGPVILARVLAALGRSWTDLDPTE